MPLRLRATVSAREMSNNSFSKMAGFLYHAFRKGRSGGFLNAAPAGFEVVGDTEHIGIADHPDDIVIVVAGGPGIHSQFLPTAFSKRP